LKHIKGANTPNWDIASTCKIDGREGLLLIVAKAHVQELLKEEKGKSLGNKNNFDNHVKIGRAIADAAAYMQVETKLPWAISRDNRYQLSNRFAWAWKVVHLGRPVILVYLGFLNASDMLPNKTPLPNHGEWRNLVIDHSRGIVPEKVWGNRWNINGQVFIPLIRSVQIDYREPIKEFCVYG
jgi:hypothetical protein